MSDSTTLDAPPRTEQGFRVVVYTRDQDSAGVIRQALSNLGPEDLVFKADNLGRALIDVADQSSPRLLIVDATGDSDPLAHVRQLIDMCEPSTSVVVLGDTNDIRLYRNIREAGAAEYIFKPLVTALVARTCQGILSGTVQQTQKRTARMVFIVGVRGGCGATSIAARLAMRLSQSPPRPVLMLDLDLHYGDSALQFDATPNHTLREALAEPERVDDLFLERGVIHVTKRLDLMAALEPLEASTDFDETGLVALIDRLAVRYRYIIADLPVASAAALNRTLHIPSVLILISDGRLVSAREVARWRNWLGVNTAERTIIHVLNMSGAPGSLPLADFTRAAGAAPDVIIPYAREVGAHSLLGLNAKPDCPTLDRGLEPVIAMLAGEPVSHKRSFLRRVLG